MELYLLASTLLRSRLRRPIQTFLKNQRGLGCTLGGDGLSLLLEMHRTPSKQLPKGSWGTILALVLIPKGSQRRGVSESLSVRDLLPTGRPQQQPHQVIRLLVVFRLWIRINPETKQLIQPCTRAKADGVLSSPVLMTGINAQDVLLPVLGAIEAIASVLQHGQTAPAHNLRHVLKNMLRADLEVPWPVCGLAEIDVFYEGESRVCTDAFVVVPALPKMQEQLMPASLLVGANRGG